MRCTRLARANCPGRPWDRRTPECAALHLPRSLSDRTLRERGAKAGLALMPLSRFESSPALNGFLLGFTALKPHEIRDGVKRLATLVGKIP